MKNLLVKVKKEKGITLVALVVTIIVLLILAGIVISLTIGNNGLFSRSKTATDVHSKEAAREKLEIALSNLELDKNTKEEYDSNGYLEEELGKEGIIVIGNIVIVDEWQFEIDRSIPKIVLDIGKGQESNNIKINAEGNISKDYVTANVVAHIDYEGTISNISINGKEVEVPEKQEGIYTINEEVEENGTYTILAKDEEDNYKIKKVQITELTEDMEIWNKEDLVSFREKVNSGRTFERRTARVMDNIDLQGTNEDQWIPIGNDATQFKGTFEGDKHTISNLYIDSDKYQRVGLFYITDKLAMIQNVVLENVKISNKYNVVEKNSFTGGITGTSNGKIINCGVNGGNIEGIKTSKNTNSSIWEYTSVGGIAGSGTNEISNCYNKANLNVEKVKDIYNTLMIGGIVGGSGSVKVINCYNQGNITSQGGQGPLVGGIAGDTNGITIDSSYNVGSFAITNYSGSPINGGIIARNGQSELTIGKITNSYCLNNVTYSQKYWDGTTSSEGIVNETTLKASASTLGEAFTNDIQNADGTWKYNNGYPILKWQLENE